MKLPWSIQLLGGLRAHSADNVVVGHFRTQKTGALFAYLATHFRHPQSRETLIERFWPDDDFDAARQSLRVALAFLRRALEPEETEPNSVLFADRVFVRLNEDAFSTDVCVFEAAIRRAQTPIGSAPAALNLGARIASWEEAISAYGGPFLPGYYDDWILAERDRLHEIWCDAHVRLAACCDQSGDWRRGLAALDALASASEAEDENPDCAWSRDARTVRERLQTKQKAAQSHAAPVSESVSPLQALLPTDGFWGREKEIADLRALFDDKTARLVTLTGPGGTGKTRLVLQAASAIAESSGDGSPVPVHIAPLAALFDPARLPDALSDALGLPRSKSANADAILQAVVARLSDGPPALLVLDNVEQIAGSETARIVGAVLTGAPHITCFATSRRRIGVPGERLFSVPPLPLPDSVALFTGRAQAVNDDFDLARGANRSDVEALCKELEGSPLAIELAAAWSAALSPVEIRERLQERFALLSSRKGDKTDRHRSLWAAIAWSYDLLPRDLQKTWARLSVFRDGWTLDAARAVTGGGGDEIAESLARLRERSLLVSLHGAHTGSLRFGMLPSLREFAEEQMDALDDSRQKHAEFFADLLRDAKPQLRGKQHAYWMKRLDDEMPNLRHALAYFSARVKSDAACAEKYLFFASAFSEFCRHRGYVRDCREQLDIALARTASLPLESPELQIARAAAVNASGLVAWMQGDTERATSDFETARAVWKAQNDIKGLGRVLGNLALLAMEHEEQERAWSLCDEALPLLKQIGDLKPIANALGTMGNARLEQERWDEGRAYHEKSLALYRELGDTDGVSIALASLGYAAQHQGDYASARAFFKESLQIRHGLGDKWRVAFSLVSIGNLLWAQKIAAPALTLYAAAEKLRADLGAPVSTYRQKEFDEKQAAMRAHIGAPLADKAHAKGDGLDYEGAVAYARYALCREKPAAPLD